MRGLRHPYSTKVRRQIHVVDFAGGSCVVALALEVFRHCCVVPPDFAKVVLKVPAFNRIRPVEYNATYKCTKLA